MTNASILPEHGTITVASYKSGKQYMPIMRYAIDVTRFRDPVGQKHLRVLDGRSGAVQEFVAQDPRVKLVIEEFCALAHVTLKEEKQNYVSFGVYDRHGRYIAPAIVEMVADALRAEGFKVHVDHQELRP